MNDPWNDVQIKSGIQMELTSSKTYTHSQGLSCCFRQWRADSHCRFLHGYALQIKLVFGCTELDKNGWCQDFGRLKNIKAWLEDTFDHKTLVAKDDPALHVFRDLGKTGFIAGQLIQLVEVEGVGCEAFAKMIFNQVASMILSDGRVYLKEVHVNEHEANGVIYKRVD